jgi:uracil-DNA glycosylase
MTDTLMDGLPAAWREPLRTQLTLPYINALSAFVADQRQRNTVLPPEPQVFAALARTPPEAVRVVLLGQDPYPTPGRAHGLAFSVARGVALPGSLRNMFKVMTLDLGIPPATHGDLGAWADRGVLLLNTVLTVNAGAPNSHQRKGWETFTTAVVDAVNRGPRRVVFLLLGKPAQKMAALVDVTRHGVVMAPHPSPLNTRQWMLARPFSEVNRALVALDHAGMDWALPP